MTSLVEQFEALSKATVLVRATLQETASAHSEAVLGRQWLTAAEQARVRSAAAALPTVRRTATAQARVRSAARPAERAGASVSEAAVARSGVSALVRAALLEQGTARSRVAALPTISQHAREVFSARSGAARRDRFTAAESAAARSAATVVARLHAVDGAAVKSTLSTQHTLRTTLLERAAVRSAATSVVTAVYAARAVASVSSAAFPRSAGDTTVWTADTYRWAMSRYTHWPIRDFSEGRYGVAPDGVYTVKPFDSEYRVDFGLKALVDERDRDQRRMMTRKRVQYVYLHMTCAEDSTLGVTAEFRGQQAQTDYAIPANSILRAVRVPVGRGYVSAYYHFTMSGQSPFKLVIAEVQYVDTRRRV